VADCSSIVWAATAAVASNVESAAVGRRNVGGREAGGFLDGGSAASRAVGMD